MKSGAGAGTVYPYLALYIRASPVGLELSVAIEVCGRDSEILLR